jgi:hypothetical protein
MKIFDHLGPYNTIRPTSVSAPMPKRPGTVLLRRTKAWTSFNRRTVRPARAILAAARCDGACFALILAQTKLAISCSGFL